jgi:hypothetical protein
MKKVFFAQQVFEKNKKRKKFKMSFLSKKQKKKVLWDLNKKKFIF